MDFNQLVEELGHLLKVSVSKKATLKFEFAPDLPAIEADPAQIGQVLMNLITNASEAIGEKSGVIAVRTGVVYCDHEYLREAFAENDLPEGHYVCLEVSDTGCGMTPEVLSKIFDPFFTTKFTGRGLGLSAVLGIVRGHKGALKVHSEPERGTTFKILFPASDRPAETSWRSEAIGDNWRASGTMLLADDEDTVREIAGRMLERMGFHVISARDGLEAIRLFKENLEDIRCVLLDLTMPHLDGEQVFHELRRLRSDIPVVVASGYHEQEITGRFAGKGLSGVVQKPYQYATLRTAIRQALRV